MPQCASNSWKPPKLATTGNQTAGGWTFGGLEGFNESRGLISLRQVIAVEDVPVARGVGVQPWLGEQGGAGRAQACGHIGLAQRSLQHAQVVTIFLAVAEQA